MDPNDLIIDNLSKSFEYAKACIEIDAIDDIQSLRDISKAYMKLYLKQQEIVAQMGFPNLS
jgi:hypothetical protein